MQLLRVATCVALVLPALMWGLARPIAADTVSAITMLGHHNAMRYAIGAPTLVGDPRVTLAAQNHANYSSLNGTGGHYETAGNPGYTGYGPRERVAAAGLSATFVSEVAASYSGALYAMTELWHAPYHRLGMMHPSASLTGWGHSDLNGRSTTVGNLVYDFGIRSVDFVRSPAHGQVVPASWSGNESPSPLPAGVRGPVGYPIMVVYSGGQNVQMRAAEIVAPGGARVPFYYVTQLYEYDYQVIIPQRPLATGTTYHVRFDITVNGRYVTNEWDFTTAGATSGGGTVLPPAPPTYNSGFLDQTPWPTLAPGASTQVTLRFRNTGTGTWTRGVAGKQANLGINGDSKSFAALGMSVNWLSADRVATTQEATVAPGGVGTFTFTVRAPLQPGEYRLPLRPVVDGVQWMADEGVFLVVKSDNGFHARWISQSPYPTLSPGQVSEPLTISFANTGGATWTRGVFGQQVNLGINRDDRTWSSLGVGWPTPDRVAVQDQATVPPGALGTFTFRVKAPATPGVYAIHLRPVADGTVWLEDYGVFLYITVR
ncbi:MAG TPA: CAP domain-containing protein [Candidatus Limnocylindria bacterium]|nr:CAP domain-containing protein [Candidatus Limnocylindria bacterium]